MHMQTEKFFLSSSGSYQPEPDFQITNPILINRNQNLEKEPKFWLNTGIPVLNPVPVIPYEQGCRDMAKVSSA